MRSVRDTAADILIDIEKNGSYSVLSLAHKLAAGGLSGSSDGALLSSLVYGVIENKITLDYNISLI